MGKTEKIITNGPVISKTKMDVKGFDTIGVPINIPAETKVYHMRKGFSTKYYVPTVCLTIGIGNDFSAEVIMTEDAYNAMNKGEKLTFPENE